MAIITQNVGTATGNWRHRRVIGYERPVWYPGTEYAARLVVTYGEQPPPPSPAPDWSAFGGQEGAWLGYRWRRPAMSTATATATSSSARTATTTARRRGRAFVYHGSATGLAAERRLDRREQPGRRLLRLLGRHGRRRQRRRLRRRHRRRAVTTTTARPTRAAPSSTSARRPAWRRRPPGRPRATRPTPASAPRWRRRATSTATATPTSSSACATPATMGTEGRAFVYLGGGRPVHERPPGPPSATRQTPASAISGATAGDVNGDGYADVIVGALGYDNGQRRGPASSTTAHGSGARRRLDRRSNQAGAYRLLRRHGRRRNGDGYADVIVGALIYDNGQADEGRAYVYHGSAGFGLAPPGPPRATRSSADLGFAWHGRRRQRRRLRRRHRRRPRLRQRPDDEGRAFVYTARRRPRRGRRLDRREQPGRTPTSAASVATAGDVNGDGYADVIVGASRYDNGQTDEGAGLRLPRLGRLGLSTTAAWTAEGDQADACFGCSRGDGGRRQRRRLRRRHRRRARLRQRPDRRGPRLSSTTARPRASPPAPPGPPRATRPAPAFGCSVATAGDVNGDGYADVIVGASQLRQRPDRRGPGLRLSTARPPAWLAAAAWTAESDQAGAYFGSVGGDGGRRQRRRLCATSSSARLAYDNGQTDEGRAFVYHGSAAGLRTTPALDGREQPGRRPLRPTRWRRRATSTATATPTSSSAPRLRQRPGRRGPGVRLPRLACGLWHHTDLDAPRATRRAPTSAIAVATAGDVNGDGYADVVVGALDYDNGQADEGRARFVYHGSPTGLTHDRRLDGEGDQADAYFGCPVATAGDVNGDGYADVIVGAPYYDNGQTDEGRAFVYLGSRPGSHSVPPGRPKATRPTPLRPSAWGRRATSTATATPTSSSAHTTTTTARAMMAGLRLLRQPGRAKPAPAPAPQRQHRAHRPPGQIRPARPLPPGAPGPHALRPRQGQAGVGGQTARRPVRRHGYTAQRSLGGHGHSRRAARRAGRRLAAGHALPLAGASPVPPGHHALPAVQPLADHALERLERSAPAHRRAADGGQTGRYGSYTRPVEPPTPLERACADRAVPGRGRGPGETSLAGGLMALTALAGMLAASPTLSIPVTIENELRGSAHVPIQETPSAHGSAPRRAPGPRRDPGSASRTTSGRPEFTA